MSVHSCATLEMGFQRRVPPSARWAAKSDSVLHYPLQQCCRLLRVNRINGRSGIGSHKQHRRIEGLILFVAEVIIVTGCCLVVMDLGTFIEEEGPELSLCACSVAIGKSIVQRDEGNVG